MITLLQINYELLAIFSSLISGGALGGLVSTIINRKENKRIKKSEAVKSEAEAKKEDSFRSRRNDGFTRTDRLAHGADERLQQDQFRRTPETTTGIRMA